jgi:hypothetical protein
VRDNHFKWAIKRPAAISFNRDVVSIVSVWRENLAREQLPISAKSRNIALLFQRLFKRNHATCVPGENKPMTLLKTCPESGRSGWRSLRFGPEPDALIALRRIQCIRVINTAAQPVLFLALGVDRDLDAVPQCKFDMP